MVVLAYCLHPANHIKCYLNYIVKYVIYKQIDVVIYVRFLHIARSVLKQVQYNRLVTAPLASWLTLDDYPSDNQSTRYHTVESKCIRRGSCCNTLPSINGMEIYIEIKIKKETGRIKFKCIILCGDNKNKYLNMVV